MHFRGFTTLSWNQGVYRTEFFLGAQGKSSFLDLFHLLEAASIQRLAALPPSPKLAIASLGPLFLWLHLLLLTLLLLPPFPCDYTGPTQVIQDNLPTSEPQPNHTCKVPHFVWGCVCHGAYLQFLELGGGHPGRATTLS